MSSVLLLAVSLCQNTMSKMSATDNFKKSVLDTLCYQIFPGVVNVSMVPFLLVVSDR